ncbi:MAG: OmpA family protein [Chitinophagales bacterium]
MVKTVFILLTCTLFLKLGAQVSTPTDVVVHNNAEFSYIVYDLDTKDSLFASSNRVDSFRIADNMNQNRTFFIFIENRHFHYIILNESSIEVSIDEDKKISFPNNDLNNEIFSTIEEGRKIEDKNEKNLFFYTYHIERPDLYLTLQKVHFDLISFAHNRDSILQMFDTLDEDLKQFSLWQKCYDLIHSPDPTFTLSKTEDIDIAPDHTKDSIAIRLQYETAQYTLTEEHKKSINKVLIGIEDSTIKAIRVIGYTDDVGSEEANYLLAQDRINAVAQYLLKIDFPSDTIIKGEKALTTSTDVETQRKNNRLVEVVIDFSINLQVGKTLVLRNVLFVGATADFLPESSVPLEELLLYMQENPTYHIDLQGHICCLKIKEDDGLSQSRAKKVYDYLAANGINKERMTYQGFGGLQPLYQNIGDYRNRRVEIMRTR